MMIAGVDRLLASEGYRCLRLHLETIGPYSPKDSEWNYCDVPHLNVVHTRVSGHTLLCTKTQSSSLFLQRIGPLLFPASLFIEHEQASTHDYLLTILNLAIRVCTRHQSHPQGCLTTTTYAFYYRGPWGWVMAQLARWATRRNYRVLMREDLPMREQRHLLRSKGVRFAFDEADLIGFTDTINTALEHVDASNLQRQATSWAVVLSAGVGSQVLPDVLLRVAWNQDTVDLWPLVCPHEGAPLEQDHGSCASDGLKCPWHGRHLGPLLSLARSGNTDSRLKFCGQSLVVQLENDGASAGSDRLEIRLVNAAV